MQDRTSDKTLAIHCAERLRAKDIFAEVVHIGGNGAFSKYALWVKTPEGPEDGSYVDLEAAFRGQVVKVDSL